MELIHKAYKKINIATELFKNTLAPDKWRLRSEPSDVMRAICVTC